MPELTPQQKTQLDSNIRAMLGKGASQEDVIKYSNDFRGKYDVPVKKNETSSAAYIAPSREELAKKFAPASDNMLSGADKQRLSILKSQAADNANYIQVERPKKIQKLKEDIITQSKNPKEKSFDAEDYLTKDMIENKDALDATLADADVRKSTDQKESQDNIYRDANSLKTYLQIRNTKLKDRADELQNKLLHLQDEEDQMLIGKQGQEVDRDRDILTPISPTVKSKADEIKTELSSIYDKQQKLEQAGGYLAKKYIGHLNPTDNSKQLAKKYGDLVGDKKLTQLNRLEAKGYQLTDEDRLHQDMVGIDIKDKALEDKFSATPLEQRGDDYWGEKYRIKNEQDNVFNKYPDLRNKRVGMLLVQQLGDKAEPLLISASAGNKNALKAIADQTGLTQKQVSAISTGDLPSESFLGNIGKGIYNTATGLLTGGHRAIGSILGEDAEGIGYTNQKISNSGDELFGNNPYEHIEQPNSLIDKDLQEVLNPKAGKYNYNAASIKNFAGTAIGNLAGFVGGTKGLGALGMGERAALFTNVIAGGYEGNYQMANDVLGKNAPETNKNLYALLTGAIQAAAFEFLPKEKLGLTKISKSANKELGELLKTGSIEKLDKEALKSTVQKALEGIVKSGGESGKVMAATKGAELANAIITSIVGEGEGKSKGFEKFAEGLDPHKLGEEFMGLALPLSLAEIPHTAKGSRIIKENLYDAGLRADEYKSSIAKMEDEGTISPQDAEKKIKVIDVMANIQKTLPDIHPVSGEKLTHKQQVEYAYNRVKELAVQAKKEGVKGDAALGQFYDRNAKELVDERKSIIDNTHDEYLNRTEIFDRIKDKETHKAVINKGTKSEVVKYLSEQALTATDGTNNGLKKDVELTTDLIAQNSPLEIKDQIKVVKDKLKKENDREDKDETKISQLTREVDMLQAGLEKTKKPEPKVEEPAVEQPVPETKPAEATTPTVSGEEFNPVLKNVHNNNSELSNIGSEQEYDKYIKNVFPESKIKDVVYHGTNDQFDKFDISKSQSQNYMSGKEIPAIFFTSEENVAKKYASEGVPGFDHYNVMPIALDIKNPLVDNDYEGKNKTQSNFKQRLADAKEQGYDSYIAKNIDDNGVNDVYAVFNPEQIHVLGSKADVGGFKKWKSENKPTTQKEEVKAQPPAPPIEPPKEEPPVEAGGDDNKAGITHAAVSELRKLIDLPEYEGKPKQTHEELIAEAQETVRNNPNAANEVLDKMENDKEVTNKDNAIAAVYKATIDAEIERKPTKELLDRARRLAKALDVSGTKLGKALESRKLIAPEDNLTNFLLDKEAAQGTPLSETQMKSEAAKYEELKTAKDALEKQLIQEREQHAKDIAELGLNKAKAKARKDAKKSNEDYKAERKATVDAAREALKKLREQGLKSTVPGLQELKAIAPHVKDFLNSLASQGIDKLDNVVSQIHADFKDVLEGITKKDIVNILAGEHDEAPKEQTKNQKANAIRLLKREAELLKELERARKGEEAAKSEPKKVEANRRIDELKKKIKEVRYLNKENNVDVEAPNDATSGEIEYNTKMQKQLIEKASKLTQDIRSKKYLEEKEKQPIFKKSRQTQLLEDKVIDLENKIRHERSKDEYSKRGKFRKAFDKVMEVLGVRRLVQSAVDISVPFRQGATMLSPRKIDVWLKGFQANLQSIFSPKKFERIMHEIRNDPMYHEMVKDNVVFNDLGSADPNLHNEDFRKSFIYKIPVISEPLKASNRSADAFLNVTRIEMYKKLRDNLEKRGLTRESDPKAFRHIGNWTMAMTGRGTMHSALEKPAMNAVLGNTFYGARLMASRFNLLNPVTYFDPRIPKEARYESMKDMVAFTTTMMAVGTALAYTTGAKISLNPDDSDFLQLRYGDKVYDISGGLANYVRTGLRIGKAAYTKASGTKYEGGKATDKAGSSVLNFFRNKLSPNTSYGVEAFFGGRYGNEFDPKDIVRIYPMYTDDFLKAIKEEGGLMAISTVLLPNILGIGYGSYASKGQIDKNLEDLLKRNTRSDEMNNEKIKNYNDGGRAVTDKEFNKFADKRDEEIEKELTKLYNNGAAVIDENNEPVIKPYKDLTQDQVIKETNRIKAAATKKVKEELFGKHENTGEEKYLDKQLKHLRDEQNPKE